MSETSTPRLRSRSPRTKSMQSTSLKPEAEETNSFFLCVILGGPGSGKTEVGVGLGKLFRGLCQVSSGDITRSMMIEKSKHSPYLKCLCKLLGERRRRKHAAPRLKKVISKVWADAMCNHPDIAGFIVDGFRAEDLDLLTQTLRCPVSCVFRIECSHETMLSRLKKRGIRDGDICEEDLENRVTTYFERISTEESALHAHLCDLYSKVVCDIDGSMSVEACLEAAESGLRRAASLLGSNVSQTFEHGRNGVLVGEIDWAEQLAMTAVKLDKDFHPDGKPRLSLQS